MSEFRILSEEEILGNTKLDYIRENGPKCATTDFAVVLGGYVSDNHHVDDDHSLKGRTGRCHTSSYDEYGNVRTIAENGNRHWIYAGNRFGSIRPVLPYTNTSNTDIIPNKVGEKNGFSEVEYGKYPQYAVDTSLAQKLESNFLNGRIKKNGKKYTTDSRKRYDNSSPFQAQEYEEYEYDGKCYIRTKYNNLYSHKLSNGQTYYEGDIVWIEISPIKWIIDKRAKLLVSKKLIISGLRFCNSGEYAGDFENTEVYYFLNNFFSTEIKNSRYENHRETKEKRKGIKIKNINLEKVEEIVLDTNMNLKENPKEKSKIKIKSKRK